jgi:tRNA threonylcarbamoyladenosine modification (KEOPS) complex Cgi121 subunit
VVMSAAGLGIKNDPNDRPTARVLMSEIENDCAGEDQQQNTVLLCGSHAAY